MIIIGQCLNLTHRFLIVSMEPHYPNRFRMYFYISLLHCYHVVIIVHYCIFQAAIKFGIFILLCKLIKEMF